MRAYFTMTLMPSWIPGAVAARIAALAVGYLALAFASGLMALPPGFASPVWPAAGLAVGALLVWGWRCWPGVWLGSFLFNSWQDYAAGGTVEVALAASIAAGAALQAILGFSLVRRLLSGPSPMARGWDAFQLVLLAGPLASMVSASIGIVSLYGFGRLPAEAIGVQWLTWWAGDSIGVMLVAPLVFLGLLGYRRASLRRALSLSVPLLVTGALMIVANLGVDRAEESNARQEIVSRAGKVFEAVNQDLPGRIDYLKTAAGLLALRDNIGDAEFQVVAGPLRDAPALLAIEWAPRVAHADRAAFEAAMRGRAGAGFRLTTPELLASGAANAGAPAREEYFPVALVEPLGANMPALGLDHAPDPRRLEAMQRAARKGIPMATEPLAIARTGREALLVFMPVYRPGFDPNADEEERIRQVRGFLVAVFDLPAMLAIVARDSGVASLAFRLTDAAAGRQLGGNLPAASTAARTGDIAFGGQNWRLELSPAAGYWRPKQSLAAQAALGVSVLAVFLVCISVLGAAGRSVALRREIHARRGVEESLRQLNVNLEREVERRTAALTENERQFRATFDVAAVGISHIAMDGRVMRVNPRMCEITGYSEAELLQSTGDELTHPEDRPRAADLIARLMRGEIPSYTLEKRYLRKDGSPVWVRARGSVVRDGAGTVQYRVLISEDISAERAASEMRAASEQRYRDLFERNPLPMWTYDNATLKFTAVNAAAMSHYGYSREEFLAMTLYDLRPAEDAAVLERELNARRPGLKTVQEVRHRKKDGSVIAVEVTTHDMDYEGRPGRLVLANDITERKRAGTLLNAQKDVLERIAAGALLEESLDKLARLVEDVAPGSLCSILLLEPGGESLRHGAAPSLPPEFVRAIDGGKIGPAAGSCGTAAFRRETVVVSDIAGDPLWTDYRDLALAHGLRACWSVPMLDAQGTVLGTFAAYARAPRVPSAAELELLGTLTHTAAIAITQTRAKRALQESEARFRAIFETSPVGMAVVARDGRILAVNPRHCEITGLPERDLVGKTIQELTHSEETARDMQQFEEVWRGERANYSIEKRALRPDGAPLWVHVVGSVVRGPDGEPLYGVRIIEDITARKTAETALRESEERSRMFFDTSPVPTLAYERGSLRLKAVNEAFTRLLGYSRDEALALSIPDLYPPEQRAAIINLAANAQGLNHITGIQYVSKDGRHIDVETRSHDYMLDGRAGRISVIVDVTEKLRAERALRESEERFRATFELAALGIGHVGRHGRFLRVNSRMCEISGYDETELLRLGPSDLTAAEDLAADLEQRKRLWRGEIQSYSVEKRYKRKDGRLVWTNATISAVRDRTGAIEYTLGILEDISWRKAAEAELQQHQELNRLLLENLAEGVVACDAEGKLILFNKAAREWHGTDPREVPPAQWSDYYDLYEADGRTPLALERIPLIRAFHGEKVLNAEMSITRKGMSPRRVLASGAPLLDAEGNKRGAVVVMHDVTERERGERRFAAMFEFAPDAIIMADAAGAIRQVNRQAETLFGWSRDELIGKPVETLMPGAARARHVGLREGFMRSTQPRAMGVGQTKLLGLRKDGTTFPIDISLSPMESPDGPMVAAAVRDTTERVRALQELERAAVELKQANAAVEHERASLAQRVAERTAELTAANQALVSARDAAEAASRAKSTFLATVSHEIRTPMNGVLGAIELLDRTGLDQKRAALLDTAQSSARSLLGLLNDLLDMAKIEAGRIEIVPAPVSLAAVVNQVVSIHLPVAITKSIALDTRIDPGLPTWMAADALRLRQILGNLVSNAVKFTARGGVELSMTSRPLQDRLHRVQFTVRDSGAGIPAEVLQTLFKPFEQGTAELARKSGGTGLGLAICRGLAERMGGSVELASEPGKGSTATLQLDLEEAEAPLAHSRSELQDNREAIASFIGERAADIAQGARVLVVDDHPTNRLLMVRQLEQLGIAADAACDGVDALDRLRQSNYALMITDCEMPRMDGYQLAQAVRSGGGSFAHLPIIACTAHALPEVSLRCRSAGMDEVLTKPIEMADLARALRKRWPVTTPATAVREERNAGSALALDRSKLSRIIEGAPGMEAELIEAFRTDLAASMASLDSASNGADYEACARLAHRGKGACLTMGAAALAAAFATLEKSARNRAPVAEMKQAVRGVMREHRRLEAELSAIGQTVST